MFIPVSAQTYISQREALTGKRLWLGTKRLEQFTKLEDKLIGLNLNPEKYVQDSIAIWQEWSESKDMQIVPINILCGEKAIKRYQDLGVASREDDMYRWMCYYEYGAAERIIEGLIVDEELVDIVQELNELWFPSWWEKVKKTHARQYKLVVAMVFDDMVKRYRVTCDFNDYESIAYSYAFSRRDYGGN